MCVVDKKSAVYYVTSIDYEKNVINAVDANGDDVQFSFNQVDLISGE